MRFVVVQALSYIRLFTAAGTAAHQASLSSVSQRSLKLVFFESVMLSNHLVLCYRLLFLLFNLPHHQGLFNESVLLIRWPTYWCFNFSISPSSEYSGLISFRNEWFDLFPVQQILRFYYERHSEMFRQSLLKAILTRRVFYHWTFC